MKSHLKLKSSNPTQVKSSRSLRVSLILSNCRSLVPGSIPGFGKPMLLFQFSFSSPTFHHFIISSFLPFFLSIFLSLFSNTLHNDVISWQEGGLAQMVERSLSMREVPGSIPGSSMSFFHQHQLENQPLFHNSPAIGQLSGWPSGLRRCVQVAVHFCGRGFESHS